MGQLSPAQLANARVIVQTGQSLGMSGQDIEIALMTALDESSLLMYANSSVPASLSYSHDAVGHDTDSLGLFQQRPSAGWGTVSQLMNANYDAGKFYDSLKKDTHRIVQKPWEAAQSVQVSAYPDGSNYQRFWGQAQDLYKQITGKTATGTPTVPTTTPASTAPNAGLFASLGTITGDLTSAEWWRRVGMFMAGGVLALIALLYIVNKSGIVQKTVKAGTKVAEVAAL